MIFMCVWVSIRFELFEFKIKIIKKNVGETCFYFIFSVGFTCVFMCLYGINLREQHATHCEHKKNPQEKKKLNTFQLLCSRKFKNGRKSFFKIYFDSIYLKFFFLKTPLLLNKKRSIETHSTIHIHSMLCGMNVGTGV